MDDSLGVVFHENGGFADIPVPRPEPQTLTRRVMSFGIAGTPAEAGIILAIFAALLIAGNVYLFAKAVPPVPVLNEDVLRAGEVIPNI